MVLSSLSGWHTSLLTEIAASLKKAELQNLKMRFYGVTRIALPELLATSTNPPTSDHARVILNQTQVPFCKVQAYYYYIKLLYILFTFS